MRKLALVPLLALSIFATAEKPKPNPADYTVKVHVISSATSNPNRDSYAYQILETDIDGRPTELTGGDASSFKGGMGVLAPGNYPARIIARTAKAIQYDRSSDVYVFYELLFPDASTRQYRVSRLGPASGTPTPTPTD